MKNILLWEKADWNIDKTPMLCDCGMSHTITVFWVLKIIQLDISLYIWIKPLMLILFNSSWYKYGRYGEVVLD